jgi:hypothetical protein
MGCLLEKSPKALALIQRRADFVELESELTVSTWASQVCQNLHLRTPWPEILVWSDLTAEHFDLPPTSDLTTSVLFIDSNDADRAYFTEALQRRSADYRIVEATDVDSGLALYRCQRIDCVVLELDFRGSIGL